MSKEAGGGAASGLLPAGSSLSASRERAPFRPPSGHGGGAGATPGRFPAREGRVRVRGLAGLGRGRDSCARGGRVRPVGSDAAKPGPRGCARAPGGAGPRWWPVAGGGVGKRRGGPASSFRGSQGGCFLGCFCRTRAGDLSCYSFSYRKSCSLGANSCLNSATFSVNIDFLLFCDDAKVGKSNNIFVVRT